MKVLHISYSDHRGGASKACYRTHAALLEHAISSEVLVALKPDPSHKNIIFYPRNILSQLYRKFLKVSNLFFIRTFQKSPNPDLHTFDVCSYMSAARINKLDVDIIHLHWVNFSLFSVQELAKIKKPIVWTFHDMWAFMGAEHYDDIQHPGRHIRGYEEKDNNIRGIDLNRFVWKLKRKYWKDFKFHIICPSTWMCNCAKESYLLKDYNSSVIPNIINEKIYFPKDKISLRKEMGFPEDKKLILFGAFNAASFNKGGDLLEKAIDLLKREDTEIIIFGKADGEQLSGFKTHYVGFIKEEQELSNYYSIADVMIVPSRIENFPNTILESINCGTPVVAFDIGGIPDMIDHKKNGYLAKAFEVDDLKNGINWVLDNPDRLNFKEECKALTEKKFRTSDSIDKLINLYQKVLNKA